VSDHSPILSPPPELAQKCWDELRNQTQLLDSATGWDKAMALAYQAGADRRGAVNEAELQKARDEELKACCEWLRLRQATLEDHFADKLRTARRPKLPTLKEEALEAWEIANQTWTTENHKKVAPVILRAIKALPDD
jgi:hypothetical protein